MFRFLATAVLVLALALPARADGPAFTPAQRDEIVRILREALKSDPSILRDAVAALQEDDAHQQAQAAQAAIRTLGPELTQNPGDPSAGNPKGPVTVVEFYDVRCPYCRRMLPTLETMLKHNPDVRLVYKDLPVLGPGSVLGARALLAAQKQGGYAKLHDALMQGSPDITEEVVRAAAVKLGLNWDRLKTDMDDPDIKRRIQANLDMARKLDIQGTPAYIVGQQMLPGAVDLAQIEQAIAESRTSRN